MDDKDDHTDDLWPYLDLDQIDFSRMYSVLQQLLFMDDLFLNMQAMNIAASDRLITCMEYSLRDQHRPDERVPLHSFIEVSALSQMWIFALYELIRLWRQRWNYLAKQRANGMLKQVAEQTMTRAEAQKNTALLIRAHQARSVLDDPTLLERVTEQFATLQPVWTHVEALRMNLAKHGAPGGQSTIVPMMPGHGRIDFYCGALNYDVVDRSGTYTTFNRRDIADALRMLELGH